MKKILFAVKTSVCCLLAMLLVLFNTKIVAMAVEEDTQQLAGATVAFVEIANYDIAEGIVEAGNDVKVNINLHNASSSIVANNVIVTLSSNSGMVYPTYGSDNQVYVGSIGANKTSTATVPITISPEFRGNAIDLICTIGFESRGARLSNTATIVLPTSNGSALAVKSIDVSPKATVYGKSLLSVNYVNNSADSINDAKLTITGNVDNDSKVIDLGAISAGKSYLKDYYITFVQTGAQNVDITLTYSDANGETVETNLGTYSVNVENEGSTSSESAQTNGYILLAGQIVSLIAMVVSIILIIVYIKKR
ncbi:MAG: hypothetical protein K6F75_05755 [Butyrivibrio sp.]|nr:hypothetical protein [Butyrivibrio sp.]